MVDSAPGITSSIVHAYEVVGVNPPEPHVMRGWIGPPIRERLKIELASHGNDVVASAQAAFRTHYDAHGTSGTRVFDGVVDLLDRLRGMGRPMAIATNKPAPLAQATLQAHWLDEYFEGVAAPPDGLTRVHKEQLLEQLTPNPAHLTEATMVGDRAGDITAALHHQMRAVGVDWGYGSAAELIGAGATVVVSTPTALMVELT